jgi:hypothetical protein
VHERPVVDRALALLEPGDVVDDVGAHIGAFALVAARAVQPDGRVSAFEPDERSSSGAGHGSATVDAVALDDVAAADHAPALVKIDVEGGELEVLAGAEALVARNDAEVLCEVHPTPAQSTRERVTALFERHGYAVERLSPESEPTHLRCTLPR